MDITSELRFTSEGVIIPYTLIHEWLTQGVELVKEPKQLIIRPKSPRLTEKERVLQILEASGLLIKPDWDIPSPPVSDAELAELAEKFSVGKPLSEIIIEEREQGW